MLSDRYLGDGEDAVYGGVKRVDAFQPHTYSKPILTLREGLVLQHTPDKHIHKHINIYKYIKTHTHFIYIYAYSQI